MKPSTSAPVSMRELFAPIKADPLAGIKALVAEADSGRRRCDSPRPRPAMPAPTTFHPRPALRCPIRR